VSNAQCDCPRLKVYGSENMFEKLVEKGIRLTIEAEEEIKKSDVQEELLQELITLNKPLISKEDIKNILNKNVHV